MALATESFTTGACTLFAPDLGRLSYNGCIFSPLFATEVSGSAIKDDAGRTVKYMEYTITVDGYVTLQDGAVDIAPTMDTLRELLTAQGGELVYKGRGCDIEVNTKAGATRDVAWGPVPELLEFQPLGAGRSAKIQWQVKTRIPEIKQGRGAVSTGADKRDFFGRGGLAAIPLLQFNYETSVGYGEDGYSTLSIRGTLEIPLTRTPGQTTRTLQQTADNLRGEIEARVLGGIDLVRFRITKRDFPLSRDKRTLNWEIVAEEKPYMDLPPDCTVARGTYSVRPAKAGMGLCLWLCTLRATYTVRPDRPRRTAWIAFLYLLRLRMESSSLGNVPDLAGGPQAPARPPTLVETIAGAAPGPIQGIAALGNWYLGQRRAARGNPQGGGGNDGRRAWLVDFNIDEGLYLDSKTTAFSATWRMVTTFSHILLASGVWRKLAENDNLGANLWATRMRDIQGVHSWLENRANPNLDIIVDFGS